MMRLATDEEYLEIRMRPDYYKIELLSIDFTFYVIPQNDGDYLPLFLVFLEEEKTIISISYMLFKGQLLYVCDGDVESLLSGTVSQPVFRILSNGRPVVDSWV